MAAHPKRARRLRAHVVLIDESGVLLAPLVRRTLAPRGQTPILFQTAQHRDRVSLLGALTVSPRRGRLGLYFSSLVNDHYDQDMVAHFLRAMLRHLRGPIIVVWDRGPMHHGPAIRQLLAQFPRMTLKPLPPYAPELNPVEQIWNYLKWSKLANRAPTDVHELQRLASRELKSLHDHQQRLRACWAGSDLPWPRALAS